MIWLLRDHLWFTKTTVTDFMMFDIRVHNTWIIVFILLVLAYFAFVTFSMCETPIKDGVNHFGATSFLFRLIIE